MMPCSQRQSQACVRCIIFEVQGCLRRPARHDLGNRNHICHPPLTRNLLQNCEEKIQENAAKLPVQSPSPASRKQHAQGFTTACISFWAVANTLPLKWPVLQLAKANFTPIRFFLRSWPFCTDASVYRVPWAKYLFGK